MIYPINPDELDDNPEIPDGLIEVINDLIKKHWDSKEAVVLQDEIASEYLKRDDAIVKTRTKLFEHHCMNFEYIYREHGWNVKYESPDRDESFKSYFKFTKVKK